MISKTLQDKINEQIKNELYSAYLYLSMSAYFDGMNLPGFAHWMQVQSQEEASHAMKFFNHLMERGARVVLQAIDQPPSEFKSVLDAFQQALAHEQKVTALINDLYALAIRENDYPAQVELQWFISEQVEEEKNAGDIVGTLKLIGEHGASLIMLDRQLGARTN
jgi:ferritin